MNINKTRYMKKTDQCDNIECNIVMKNNQTVLQHFKKVKTFTYLGVLVSNNASDQE